MRLRDDDIVNALASRSLSSGLYEPSGRWQLRLGDDLAVLRGLMVSRHEATHGLLNRTTSFGTVILALGAIEVGSSPNRSAHARNCLVALVNRCRTTHEVVATAWGVYATDMDAEVLLSPYPGYGAYYAQAVAIAPGWPERSVGKQLAVLHFTRTCMQSRVLEQLLQFGVDGFTPETISEEDSPDSRFTLLRKAMSEERWAELETNAKSLFASRGLADIFLPQDAPHLHSRDIYVEFQEWLCLQFAAVLRDQGATVLGLGERERQTVAFLEMLKGEGEAGMPLLADAESDSRQDARELIHLHTCERLIVRDEPLPADIKDDPFCAPPLVGKLAGVAHHFLSRGLFCVFRSSTK